MPSAHNNLEVLPAYELGLSIIVPILNEIEVLPSLVEHLSKTNADQIIMVDGGSDDGSCEWLEENWKSDKQLLIRSKSGRAKQMNAGAELASQEMLLFLHADSLLPENAKQEICLRGASRIHWGRFDIRFDSDFKAMDTIAAFINRRSRVSSIATGDQGIYMHKTLFTGVGGFDQIDLMEDVAMCKKLCKIMWPHCSKLTITTSARRWEQNGVANTVLKMWWFRLAFFLGFSPTALSRSYKDIR